MPDVRDTRRALDSAAFFCREASLWSRESESDRRTALRTRAEDVSAAHRHDAWRSTPKQPAACGMHILSCINRLCEFGERLVDVDLRLGRCFEVLEVVLVRVGLRVLVVHHALLAEVALVAHQHDLDVTLRVPRKPTRASSCGKGADRPGQPLPFK